LALFAIIASVAGEFGWYWPIHMTAFMNLGQDDYHDEKHKAFVALG
jgi:hypothetical protein